MRLGGLLYLGSGRISVFGGQADTGMRPNEGLALFTRAEALRVENSALFGPNAADPAVGLGRALRPEAFYIAARWNYRVTSREELQRALVVCLNGRRAVLARPVDWGPAANTGRVFDLSPGLAQALGVCTDQTISCWLEAPAQQIVQS